MLVLSRKLGERFRIGDDVEVTVLRILGNKVRLGVTAPRSVVLKRQEVCDIEGSATSQDCRPEFDAD